MKTQALAPLYTSARELIGSFCAYTVNRGSYISDHVLLNLLNELGESDKMRDLSSILSLFRNEFK